MCISKIYQRQQKSYEADFFYVSKQCCSLKASDFKFRHVALPEAKLPLQKGRGALKYCCRVQRS